MNHPSERQAKLSPILHGRPLSELFPDNALQRIKHQGSALKKIEQQLTATMQTTGSENQLKK